MRRSSEKCPLGVLAFAPLNAVRTCSRPMPYLFSAVGFSSTRTAGREPPPTVTCPTPVNWASFCAMIVDAASYIWPLVRTAEVRASRIHFPVRGLVGKIGWQVAAGGVDGGLHVARGRVDVPIQSELQRDAGGSERARRSH